MSSACVVAVCSSSPGSSWAVRSRTRRWRPAARRCPNAAPWAGLMVRSRDAVSLAGNRTPNTTPRAAEPADQFTFEYVDCSFDLTLATSVFTQLLAADAQSRGRPAPGGRRGGRGASIRSAPPGGGWNACEARARGVGRGNGWSSAAALYVPALADAGLRLLNVVRRPERSSCRPRPAPMSCSSRALASVRQRMTCTGDPARNAAILRRPGRTGPPVRPRQGLRKRGRRCALRGHVAPGGGGCFVRGPPVLAGVHVRRIPVRPVVRWRGRLEHAVTLEVS